MVRSSRSRRSFGKRKTKEGLIRNDCQIETCHQEQKQHGTLRVARGLKIDFYQQGRTSLSAKEGLRSSLRHLEREQHELRIRE